MRFKVVPRDVPPEVAARRLGMTLADFDRVRDRLSARGFPAPDPDTGQYDLAAIDAWCDRRHAHLFAVPVTGAHDAGLVAGDRIARLRGGA